MTEVTALVMLLGVAGAALMAEALRRQEPAVRRRLLLVLAVALLLRIVVTLVVHLLGPWDITPRGASTPDEAVTDAAGRLLSRGDERSPVTLGGSLHTAWLLTAATVYQVWDSLLALKLLNAVLGAALVVPVFLVGRRLGGPDVGLLAAAVCAVFPTSLVWSALGLREPLIALLVTGIVAVGLELFAEAPARRGALLIPVGAIGLVLLGFSRSYMVPAMAILIVGATALASMRDRTWRTIGSGVAILAAALALFAVLPRGLELVRTTAQLASEQAPSVYNPLSDCSDESACTAAEGNLPPDVAAPAASGGDHSSDRGASGRPTSLTSSLQSVREKGLLRAVAIAVLAGRPVWLTDEYFFLLQPGVLLWWGLVPGVVAGSLLLLRRRMLAESVLVTGFVGLVIVFLAYSGQFVRHHYMLEPLGIVLAALAVSQLSGTSRRIVAGLSVAMLLAGLVSVGASLL